MAKTHEEKRIADLMVWVTEYGIADDIKNHLIEEGYESALCYIRTWFDGWGEADTILEQFT